MKKVIIFICLLFLAETIVWAADVKISDMKTDPHPDGGDIIPFVDVSGSTNRIMTITQLIASGVTSISGTTINWTSGTTLPLLAGATDYVQAQINEARGAIAAGSGGEVSKAQLDGHTNDGGFSGTSNFALKAALTASTVLDAFAGTTGFATKTELTNHTTTLSGVSGEATKASLDAHTNDGSFSGTSNFALKAALTASTLTLSGVSGEATKALLASHTDAAAYESSTGGVSNFALKAALTNSTALAAFSGTTWFVPHSDLAANTLSLSGVSGEATKAQLASHSDAAAFASSTGGVSNFATKAALTASVASGVISGTSIDWTSGTTLPRLAGVTDSVQTQINAARAAITAGSGTVRASSEIGLAMYNAAGSAVTGFVSGTSGAVLMSAGSGATPVWGTELNISLATNQATQKNRLLYFDENGTMSGATPIQYSGVSLSLNLSGVSTIIQSGTSPTGICTTGWIYLDTDDDTNGELLLCVATGQWKAADDDGGAVEVTKALLDGHTNPAAFSGSGSGVSNFAPKAALTASVEAAAFSGTTGFALKTALTAATNANIVSGTSIDWTSGTTLPNLKGVPDFDSGVSSYVLTAKGVGVIPIWTNLPSTTAEVSKSMLDGHTNDGAYSGTSNFALKASLTASVASGAISGTSIDWTSGITLPRLSGVTDSVQAQINAARGAISLGGETDAIALAALTAHTNLAAFSGTTWFATHAEVAANTVTLSGVSGEATKAQLASHTDAAAYASSTGGVSDFALKTLVSSALNSGATLEQANTNTVVGKLFYDTTGPQVATYGATASGNTEWVVSAVTDFISFVISGVTHGKDNLTPWGSKYTGQDDMILLKPPYNIVLKEALGITDSGATVIWNLGNCDSAGANCVDMLSSNIASGSTGNLVPNNSSVFANSDVTAYQTLRLNVIWSGVSSSGVTANFTGIVNYWKQRR